MGLFRGFLAPFRGGAFIARHRLGHYMALPFLLSAALGAATMFGVQYYLRHEPAAAPIASTYAVMRWLLMFGRWMRDVGLTLLASAIIFVVFQPILLAVFSDRLSERVERSLAGTAPSAPFLASTGRALVHGLLKSTFYGITLVVAAVLSVITGPIIGGAAGIGLGAISLAYDGFDYPLSRRSSSFGGKWSYLARHPGQTIGFGLGTTLLYLIPFAFLVAPPLVAAGATVAFLEAGKVSGPASDAGKVPASASEEKSPTSG